MQQILLKRNNAVYVPTYKLTGSYTPVNKELLSTFLKNLESVGWILSQEFIDTLKKSSASRLQSFYLDILNELKLSSGLNKEFVPLFPNFPNTLMNDSESEEYLNQYDHFLKFSDWPADISISQRAKLCDPEKLKVLNYGTKHDLVKIGINLLNKEKFLTVEDTLDLNEIISWSFNNTDPQLKSSSQEIFLNELNISEPTNIITYLNILKKQKKINYTYFSRYAINNPTLLLKYLVAVCGGDTSLNSPTKFKLKASDRKLVMLTLQTLLSRNQQGVIDSFHKYSEQWKRIGEVIHPKSFSSNYSVTKQLFQELRENKLQKSFNQAFNTYVNLQEWIKAAKVIATRPNELAKKLDFLLRNASPEDQVEIINIWNQVSIRVSTKSLLELWKYFSTRTKISKRVIFPKKGNSRMWVEDYTPYPIEPDNLKMLVAGLEAELSRKLFIKTEKTNRKIFIEARFATISIKGGYSLHKATLLDLLNFWVKANNHSIVGTPEEADEIFKGSRIEIIKRFF